MPTYFLAERPTTPQDGRTYTNRGFEDFGEFVDMYGSTITVRESSNIEGGVWVFCHNERLADPSPHLNADQIDQLITALTEARDCIYGVEGGDER